jgi:uncharacterized membrane protein YoaK (UPF0700 family)
MVGALRQLLRRKDSTRAAGEARILTGTILSADAGVRQGLLEAHMSATHRLTFVMTVALVLIAGILGAALMGTVTWSTAIWFAVAVGVLAAVAAKFHRHAELPDSVRLH